MSNTNTEEKTVTEAQPDKGLLFGKIRRADLIQVAKFLMVGTMNTLVYYGVYYLLLQLDCHFAAASTVGTVAGLINSYFWNKYFVFKYQTSKKTSSGEIIKFCVVYGVQYLSNLGIIYVCITYIGLTAELAGIVAAGLCAVISYTGLRFWGFKK